MLSAWIGATMQRVGKKNYLIIGFVFLITSTLGFATLYYTTEKWVFFAGAVIFRFIQGIGGTCLQVAGYTIALSEFSRRKEVSLAYMNAARGLGFLGGPISG